MNKIKKDDLISIIYSSKEFDQASELQEIKDSIAEIKETVLKRLLDQNNILKDRIKEIECTNAELCKKSLLLEHWKLNQYTRRNNIEIASIQTIKNEVLEDTVVKILDKIGVKCYPTVIEACHRLLRNRRTKICNTIVRFVNRKTAEKSLMYRKNLKSIDLSDIDESFKESKVFVNDNLCPYYKEIYGKCIIRAKLILSGRHGKEKFSLNCRRVATRSAYLTIRTWLRDLMILISIIFQLVIIIFFSLDHIREQRPWFAPNI